MSLLPSIINLKPFISPADIWKADTLSTNIYILNLTLQDFFFSGVGGREVKKEGQ